MEEWIQSVKAAMRLLRGPEDDHVDFVKDHLQGQAKATVKVMATAKKRCGKDI